MDDAVKIKDLAIGDVFYFSGDWRTPPGDYTVEDVFEDEMRGRCFRIAETDRCDSSLWFPEVRVHLVSRKGGE